MRFQVTLDRSTLSTVRGFDAMPVRAGLAHTLLGCALLLRDDLLIAVMLCMAVSGCVASNIAEAPPWTQGRVPAEILRDFPEATHLQVRVVGEGLTASEAREAARAQALSHFSQIVQSDVKSRYIQWAHSEFGIDSVDSTGSRSAQSLTSGGSYSRWIQRIESIVEVESAQALSGVEEVLSWDGYEGPTKYHHAIFVLDQRKAAERASQLERQLTELLTEISGVLRDPRREASQKASFAVKALGELPRLRILQWQRRFFGYEPAVATDLSGLETCCVSTIESACGQLASAGAQSGLEEALSVYQEGVRAWPASTWSARIASLKERLPCVSCGKTGICAACQGHRGQFQPCEFCHGSKEETVACGFCKGAGRALCVACQGRGVQAVDCHDCSGGLATCPTCKGDGVIDYTCDFCGGTRRTAFHRVCPWCGGTGERHMECRDQFVLQRKVPPGVRCGGSGQAKCPRCTGTGKVTEQCGQCGGAGSTGHCDGCRGSGRLTTRCRECNEDGLRWIACRACGSSGKCPTCGGKSHRV